MFQVAKNRCDQCLFSENRIVSEKRKAQILRDSVKNDRHFICHKATINGKDICCRGFYDSGIESNLMRVARRLDAVEFVELPKVEGAAPKGKRAKQHNGNEKL